MTNPAPGPWIETNGTRALTTTTQRWVKHPTSVRRCGTPIHRTVTIHYSPRRPIIMGLQQCRNRFVCPHCSWHLRVTLAQRWWRVLAHMSTDYHPALVTLSIPTRAKEHLGSALADLTATWQHYRSLDATEIFGSSTYIYAWALEIIIGGRHGPQPQINCLTVPTESWDPDPQVAADRVTDLWLQATHATTTRTPTPTNITHNYLTPETTQPALNHAVGLDRHPDLSPDRSTDGSTLLELALRAHLNNNTKAGRLLAQSARHLIRRKSYAESSNWKQTATTTNAVPLDANSIYQTIYTPHPQLAYTIRSADYTKHKPTIDHWTDTTNNPTRPQFQNSLHTLLDQTHIQPTRIKLPT